MTKYEIYIRPDEKIDKGLYISGNKSLYVSVSEAVPYDKLSKRFNRYTHEIEYKEKTYVPKDYTLYIYDPNAWIYKYILSYYYPSRQIKSIDVFFPSNDKENKNPLVFGFNYDDDDETVYYTYYHLRSAKSPYHSIPSEGSFDINDLLTRLLEELGLYTKTNKDKLVIEADRRPTKDSPITYPKTGPNKLKITVRRSYDHSFYEFAKFTHSIKPSDISGFYISYNDNTIFIDLNNEFKRLNYFNVYYKIFDSIKPVLFELKFQKGTKIYGFSQFENDLKNSKLTKKIGDLSKLNENKIYEELKTENDRVHNYVTYSIDKKTEYSYQIFVSQNLQFQNEYGFKNYTHRPYMTYNDKKSQLVFNGSKLLKWKTFGHLTELYDSRSVVFDLVDVYFGTRNTKFPLIVKLTKKGQSSNNPDFFVHKQSSSMDYWEQLHVRSKIITHEILISKLKKTEFDLVKPIVLLLDKKANYTYRDIVYGVGTSESHIDFILSDVDPNGIKAEDKTGTLGKCISDKGYRVVEHDLSSFSKLDADLALRFYTLNSKGDSYTEITLHSSDQSPSDAHEDYIYFDKIHNSVYVYLYSTHNMPLMLCYGNRCYKLLNLDLYSQKWVKVHNLTNYLCREPKLKDKENLLLSTLEKIVASLNLTSRSRPSEPQKHTPISTSATPSIHIGQKPALVKETTHPTYAETRDKGTVEIDLSKNFNTNYGPSSNITVNRNEYSFSHLFCYFTHNLKDMSTFTISSLLIRNSNRRITILSESVKEVKSVNVYFNIYNMNNPVMIDITTSNNKTKYYANIIQDKQSYDFSSFEPVSKENLTNKLLVESDRVNKTLTYQIEKTVKAGDSHTYGYQEGIKVSKVINVNHFTVHKHEPIKNQSAKSYVLFNKDLLVSRTRGVKTRNYEVQGKTYKNIKIYSLSNDTEFPLIIQLNDTKSKATNYVCRKDGYGEFWEQGNLESSDDKIYYKLRELNYPLKKSIIIELDKNDESTYEMKLIDNSFKNLSNKEYEKVNYRDGKAVGPENQIKVSTPSKVIDSSGKAYTDYKFLSHEIPETTKSSDIAGIRIFMPRIGGTLGVEIELYDKDSDANYSKNKLLLYYSPKSNENKIYGYFHSNDSRPLLLCYNRRVYKRLNINDNSKWVFANEVRCYESSDVIQLLKTVHGTMKKKLTFLKSGNKENVELKEESVGNFKRTIYIANTRASVINSSFVLPKSEIIQGMNETESINKLLDGLSGKPFDSVSIYYQNNKNNLFLFEFIDESIKTHFQRVGGENKYWISNTFDYKSISELGPKLSQLKTTIDSTVVYEIDKMKTNYNISIKVDKDPNFKEAGFTKFTHSPVDGKPKSSLILFLNEELKKKQGDDIVILSDIQNKTYKHISVYFGSKAKDKKIPLENIPLVIELFNSGSGADSRTFYRLRRDSTGIYWELAKFVEAGNTHLNIINLLKQTEFDFLESIIILTDLTTRYGENEMKQAIENLNVFNEIVTAGIDNDSLIVTEKENPDCLLGSGFKYREYNLNRTKDDVWYGLRVFTRSSRDKKYNELHLNNPANFYKEFLYHKRDDRDDKVYVFFYEDDPRPLMVCYRKIAYRPMKLNEYFDRWYRDVNVMECCQEYGVNYALIEALSYVVAILNEVNLSMKLDYNDQMEPNKSGSESKTYDLQTFNGEAISVEVTYRNMKCYRAYKHEPIGLGSNGSGFRLGDITHMKQRQESTKLGYDLTKPLKAVTVYYSLFDTGHKYPLLVILEFSSDDERQFFELNDYRYIKWQPISDKIADSDIENRIKQIVDKLEVPLDKSEHAPTLFDRKECHEDSNNTTVIGATSGTLGTMATVGTGVGVTAAVHPEWFIPVIRALV